ncbi:MAG: NrsF family protein, partial [Pseudolabrys sp.]
PGTHTADLSEARDCLIFIVALSVPLSALLIIMLRRACPLDPRLTALTAGLASAAAAATLLNFFHPFDAAATDLAVHVFAVVLVIVANQTFSGRLLATNFSRSGVTRAVAGSN